MTRTLNNVETQLQEKNRKRPTIYQVALNVARQPTIYVEFRATKRKNDRKFY